MASVFALTNFFPLAVGISALIMGVFILARGWRITTHWIFFLLCVSIFTWAGGIVLLRSTNINILEVFWAKTLYISTSLTVTFFLLFTFLFPSKRLQKRWTVPFITGLAVVMLLIIVWDGWVVSGVQPRSDGEKITQFGPLYPLFAVYLLGLFTWGYVNLFRQLRKAEGTSRAQIKYVLLGTLLATVIGVVTNLIMPMTGDFSLRWLGPVGPFVMVVLISLAIYKLKLFNIGVVIAEILTIGVLFFLLLDIFISDTIREALYRGLFFLITLPLGLYLLRAVRREVLARERIQHLNEKLQRANKEIKKVYKSKSEFLDIASHQLRTPVTVIVGTLDMFREGSVDSLPKEKRDEMLRRALSCPCFNPLGSSGF